MRAQDASRVGQGPATATSREDLLQLLRSHPALAAPQRAQVATQRVSSGFAPLDALLQGGFVSGAISELVGPSGKTSLALAAAAAATQRGEVVGWIDASNSLDPRSAQAAGVALERFLWVRPSGARLLARTLQAADLILDAGGFALLVLDVSGVRRAQLAAHPAWGVRLGRRCAQSRCALLVLGELGAASSLRLGCRISPAQPTLHIRVLRKRNGAPGAQLRLHLGQPVD